MSHFKKSGDKNDVPVIKMTGTFSFNPPRKKKSIIPDMIESAYFEWTHLIRTHEDWIHVFKDDKPLITIYINLEEGLFVRFFGVSSSSYQFNWDQLVLYTHISYLNWFDMSYRHLLGGSELYWDHPTCFSQKDWSPVLTASCSKYDDKNRIIQFGMGHSSWGKIDVMIKDRVYIMAPRPSYIELGEAI